MSQQAKWYPPPTGNTVTDAGFRQAFDAIYNLRDSLQANLTGTLDLPSGFTFNGKTVTKLSFSQGQLTGVS